MDQAKGTAPTALMSVAEYLDYQIAASRAFVRAVDSAMPREPFTAAHADKLVETIDALRAAVAEAQSTIAYYESKV